MSPRNEACVPIGRQQLQFMPTNDLFGFVESRPDPLYRNVGNTDSYRSFKK